MARTSLEEAPLTTRTKNRLAWDRRYSWPRLLKAEGFWLLVLLWSVAGNAARQPPSVATSAHEPVKYVGEEQPDKRFYDGALRHAVGVHRYQAFRANRASPSEGGLTGWTYNHQPYLAYWNGRFYLQYLSTPKEEHHPPGRTLLMTSKDGHAWSNPQVIFPEYVLPEINNEDAHLSAGAFSVMHQRMGFYVAPNGRLLTLAFYGYCATPRHSPNAGNGLGRVVREIHKDGSFGPIYFIRYNRHAGFNETNTSYPCYTNCTDSAFLEACNALLANKLVTLQWWEEDRGKDGFFALDPSAVKTDVQFNARMTTSAGAGKAFCFYHRPDRVVVGLWKNQFSALSPDEGKTWTPVTASPTLMTCGAKVWGQQTVDGRYAIVYNHSATRRNRFPLVVMTGEDGHQFDRMLCLHGEVPPVRFQGLHKNSGPQYIRGIIEGNGTPPGSFLWNVYSVNKEDIWCARTRLPVAGTVDQPVREDFNSSATEADLEFWNLYVPRWAPISIVPDPMDEANRCLELRDEEPYDYALAERAFPESRKVAIEFRVLMRQVGAAALEFEVQSRTGKRPLRLRFDPEWLSLDMGDQKPSPLTIQCQQWLKVRLTLDCSARSYDLALNDMPVRRGVAFAEDVGTIERLLFRTGLWRGDVRTTVVDGQRGTPGLELEDLPGADQKAPLSIYLIDDLKAGPPQP